MKYNVDNRNDMVDKYSMPIKYDSEDRRINQLRDKEQNDETLTGAERREFKALLKRHPYRCLVLTGDFVKGCRD